MLDKAGLTEVVLEALWAGELSAEGYEYVEVQRGEGASIFIRAKQQDRPGQLFELTVKEVR